jgi:hypothetical protein
MRSSKASKKATPLRSGHHKALRVIFEEIYFRNSCFFPQNGYFAKIIAGRNAPFP